MKIVLANSVGRDALGQWIIHSPSRWTEAVARPENWFVYYPWELAYLSSLLKKETGHDVTLVDGCLERLDARGLARRISGLYPELLIVESGSRVFRENLEAALEVKKNTGARIAFVGSHASAFPEAVLARGADAVFVGEYEETVCRAVRVAGARMAGVYARAERPVDLSRLPWPEDADVSRLAYSTPGEPSSEYREIQMYATRGCPRRCPFCVAVNLYYGRPGHRVRPVADVVAELLHLRRRYPAMEGVFFDEESHNANRDYLLKLFQGIRSAGLDTLRYEAMCDLRMLDRDLMERMREAGYYKVRFGVETLHEPAGLLLGKPMDEETLRARLSDARAAGLKTYGTFMTGLPGGGEEADRRTFEIMRRLIGEGLLENAQLSIAIPQPGTPFYQTCLEKQWLVSADPGDLEGGRCVFNMPEYPASAVEAAYRRGLALRDRATLIRMLRHPRQLLETLARNHRRHGNLVTLRRGIARLLREIRPPKRAGDTAPAFRPPAAPQARPAAQQPAAPPAGAATPPARETRPAGPYAPGFFSVVIVTWNAGRFVRACLEHVRRQTYRNFEVILVDNGSTDETLPVATDMLTHDFKDRFHLVRNPENRGFCTANNQGIRLARGEYVLLLNSDVTLDPHFLESALDMIRTKPRTYGLFNPKILRADRLHIDTLGIRLTSRKRFFNLHAGELDQSRFEQSMDIFGPCGAAAIVRHETLDAVRENEADYFDPRFFFLAEDIDLAWRASKKGWKSMYLPQPVCCHHGASSAFGSRHRQYLSFRNRYYLIMKHEGPAAIFRYLFDPYDLARLAYLLVTSPALTLKALRETADFFRQETARRKP